jgi:hypothetical protein
MESHHSQEGSHLYKCHGIHSYVKLLEGMYQAYNLNIEFSHVDMCAIRRCRNLQFVGRVYP